MTPFWAPFFSRKCAFGGDCVDEIGTTEVAELPQR